MPYPFTDNNLPAESVWKLYRHADWAKDRTLEETREVLRQSSLVLGLLEAGEVIAFSRVLTDFIFRATIYDVIVHPDFRGRGIGKQMVHALLHHPRLASVPVFYLLTRDKRPFYEKNGFVLTSQKGLDAMIFARE
jgi:ribosomal protein S18 acetylase RimI-like enzyme